MAFENCVWERVDMKNNGEKEMKRERGKDEK